MDKKIYIAAILLVFFSVLVYAGDVSLAIPNSTQNENSVLTWGESGTYTFTFSGIDPNQAIACANRTGECDWKMKVLLQGISQWNGTLFEKVGYIGKWNHVSVTVNDLGGGSAEVVFTATPPAGAFSGAPFTTWYWHGIEYQTWALGASFRKSNSIQQLGGTLAIVVIESMDKINEFLTDESAPTEGGVEHLNYTLNDANVGVLTLTNEIYNSSCTTYKPGWETFVSDELEPAKSSLESLNNYRQQLAADYENFTVDDAINLQYTINWAAGNYKDAANEFISGFGGCACVEGC